MKTLHAPDTLPAALALVRETALANPVLAYAALVAFAALAAVYLARSF